MSDFDKFGTAVPDTDGKALEWDSEIEQEGGGQYRLLPEGDYPFTVKSYDRSRHEGSEKIPPCWKAVIHLIVHDKDGDVEVQNNLFLHEKQEWTLSQFFIAIGQKKHGEKLKMRWNDVPGSTGVVHLAPREWKGKQYNNVKYFVDPEKAASTPSAAAGKGFTAGAF
jgi:hypothetical protein